MNLNLQNCELRSQHFLIMVIILTLNMAIPFNSIAQSPYEMSWKKDRVLLVVGIPLTAVGLALNASVSPLTLDEIKNLDRENIPKIDRFASYNYSENASNLSDILLYTCIASPFLLLSSSLIRNDFWVVYGMYAESLIIGVALPAYGKGGVQRIRPYTYNPNTPMEKKLTAESKKSFFSGHTSVAFTSMIFLSTIYSKYHPNSKWRPYIWTGSVLVASTVGYFRIAAGAHFLTDVLVGAIVGATIGYIIPKIHETDYNDAEYQIPDAPTRSPGISFQFSL